MSNTRLLQDLPDACTLVLVAKAVEHTNWDYRQALRSSRDFEFDIASVSAVGFVRSVFCRSFL